MPGVKRHKNVLSEKCDVVAFKDFFLDLSIFLREYLTVLNLNTYFNESNRALLVTSIKKGWDFVFSFDFGRFPFFSLSH